MLRGEGQVCEIENAPKISKVGDESQAKTAVLPTNRVFRFCGVDKGSTKDVVIVALCRQRHTGDGTRAMGLAIN
jgi:hypothetical protein